MRPPPPARCLLAFPLSRKRQRRLHRNARPLKNRDGGRLRSGRLPPHLRLRRPAAARWPRTPSPPDGTPLPAAAPNPLRTPNGGSGPLLATDRRRHSPPVGFAAFWRLLLREVSGAAAATPPRRSAPWRRLRWGPRVRRGCSAKAPAAAGRWRFCGVFGKSLTHPPYRAEKTRRVAPLRRRRKRIPSSIAIAAERPRTAIRPERKSGGFYTRVKATAAVSAAALTVGGEIAASSAISALTPLRIHNILWSLRYRTQVRKIRY